MLIGILAGVIFYYLLLSIIGVLVKSLALQGTLVVFAVVCFIGGYLARSSRFVSRMAYWLGGITTAIWVIQVLLLPVLTATTVAVICVLFGLAMFVVSRRPIHRRLLRRDRNGNRPAPPFGREWCRWLIAFAL